MESKAYNLMQLEAIASALQDLLPRVTFVGGSTTVLLVDEAAHFGVRKTDDNVRSRCAQPDLHCSSKKLDQQAALL